MLFKEHGKKVRAVTGNNNKIEGALPLYGVPILFKAFFREEVMRAADFLEFINQ